MRTTLTILICVFSSLTTLAQSPDVPAPSLNHLMNRALTDCRDIVYNCQAMVPRYADQATTDSLWIVLQYWVNKCGESEQTLRLEILLNLKDKTFYEEHYKNDLLDLLFTYRDRVDRQARPAPGESESVYDKNDREFDRFTTEYARELTKENNPRTLEYLLCEYYGNNFDPLVKALQQNKIPNTFLQNQYAARFTRVDNRGGNQVDNQIESNLALIGEWWIPTQGASILGPHPGLGAQLGVKHRKFLADLTVIIRFVNARNQYEVYSQNTVMTTRHFFGGYVGIDLGREMWRKGSSEFDLVGGIGYDGFEAIAEDVDAGVNSKSINSLNINLGIGYRYYYKDDSRYLCLQPRINAVNYANKAGSDLSGNTVSIRLIWGFAGNN